MPNPQVFRAVRPEGPQPNVGGIGVFRLTRPGHKAIEPAAWDPAAGSIIYPTYFGMPSPGEPLADGSGAVVVGFGSAGVDAGGGAIFSWFCSGVGVGVGVGA